MSVQFTDVTCSILLLYLLVCIFKILILSIRQLTWTTSSVIESYTKITVRTPALLDTLSLIICRGDKVISELFITLQIINVLNTPPSSEIEDEC